MASPDPVLVVPVLLSTAWALFLLFYASRLLAALVTFIANLLLKDSGIHIGSLHVSLLAGRVLFKNLHYYCRDYSVRITDGYVSVRWCASCYKRNNYCSKCTRASKGTLQRRSPVLFFQLNGLEYHWYNRSDVYDNWGKSTSNDSSDIAQDHEESALWRWWKATQPSLHFSLSKGRVLLGNHLTEHSLVLYFTKAEAHYSTAEGSTPYDELMHVVDWYGDSIRLVAEKSYGYSGPTMRETPPDYCKGPNDSYLFLKTDSAHVRYSLDSPGLVPLGETQPPKFAFDVLLGENSVINYGCYANRLRPNLQQFFFPNDYTVKAVSRHPEPGERRIFTRFDVSFTLSTEAEFYMLFSNKGDPHHLKIDLSPHSTLTLLTPLTTGADGYSSTLRGDLCGIKVSSSLDFPSLGQAEDVSFIVDLHFPRVWNATQTWDMKFTGHNAQVNILFSYIDYVNALLDDWVGDEPADLMNFVPYNWRINIDLLNYEIFLFTNRYNWIDVAPDGKENGRLAFCGTTGQITFHFPFTEFIPPEQKIHFSAKGQNIVVRRYLPPSSSTRDSNLAITSENKHRWRILPRPSPPTIKKIAKSKSSSSSPSQRSKVTISKGSSLAGSQPTLDKELTHSDEHVITAPGDPAPNVPPSLEPTPKLSGKPSPRHQIVSGITMETSLGSGSLLSHDSDAPRGEEEEPREVGGEGAGQLPDTQRFPMGYCGVTKLESGWVDLACGPSISIIINYSSHNHDVRKGDSTPLIPNLLNIDIDAPVVLLRVFGSLGRDLLALKENYPGEYINFTVFNSDIPSQAHPEQPPAPPLIEAPPPDPPDVPDAPQERTLNIVCTFQLCNITAEFPLHVPAKYRRDFPLPSASTDLFRVYVEYFDRETKVRLHVDPATIHLPSMVSDSENSMGHVVLNGVDFRCHGLTEYLCQERVEYAWLMQLCVGRIAGAFSTQQLLSALDWFYTSFIHISSLGDAFCVAPDADLIEPKVDEQSELIKYKLLDLSIEEADIHIMEDSALTRLQSPGFDLGLCTLHSEAETLGLSLQLQGLTATTYVPSTSDLYEMLEVGQLDIGKIQGDLHLRERLECVPERQVAFLERADAATRRLWFLWKDKSSADVALCGCCGGCLFLDGAIERQLPKEKIQSAVYCPLFPSLHQDTLSRHLGLQPLKRALLGSKALEVDCVRSIHRGLLDHYSLRYGVRPETQVVLESSPQENTSASRKSLSLTSEESFVSARSSLTSFFEDEQFVSLQNINEAGVEGVAVGGWGKHRKKPSADLRPLFVDVRDEPDVGEREGRGSMDNYQEVLPTHMLRPITLLVPMKSKQSAGCDSELRPPMHPAVFRMRSAPETPSSSPFHRLFTSNSDPKSQPSLPFSRGTSVDYKDSLKLIIPVLRSHSSGTAPTVVQRDSARPKERKRRGLSGHFSPDDEKDESKLSTVSLGVQINGRISFSLTPLLLGFLDRVVNSAGTFFAERSASFVLDTLTHDTSSAVNSHLTQLLKDKPFNQPHEKPHPLLHLTVAMASTSYATVQLLQAPKQLKLEEGGIPSNISLKKIAEHSSLLVCYASGVGLDALLETASELQETLHNRTHREEERAEEEEGDGATKVRTKIDSFKVSADVKLPIVQLAVCAVVPEKEGLSSNLPSLSQVQSQLHFQLNNLPPITESRDSKAAVCVLLEAGLRESTATCVAEIVQSELSEEAILTWRNVQGYQLKNLKAQPTSEDCSEKKNRIVFSASLPLLWSQLASPNTGIASAATGGIDMLVLMEAMDGWQKGVEQLVSSTQALIANKSLREKKVLLTLISNAAQVPPARTAGNPVHSKLSSAMRQTVVYCCVHQLWRSLSLFSEDQLPLSQGEGEGDLELQLLAAMLALSARAYLKQEQSSTKRKRLKSSLVEPSRGFDCSSCGPLSPRAAPRAASPTKSDPSSELTVGYVSISPSPSELAMPNVVYTSRENLLDNEVDYSPILSSVPFSSLVVLRESLLPFYIVSGLQVEPQLSTLCHNSADYFLDLTLTVREVTVFVCKSVDVTSSSSSSPNLIVNISPSLIGEQLAVSGCVRYCTSPKLGRVQRSQPITLLKPLSDQESNEVGRSSSDDSENKTNISCKCCVSLDNLASTVTTPLLKLSRHMIETARFRAKVKKQANLRADDLLATPRPPLDDDEEDGERVPEVVVVGGGPSLHDDQQDGGGIPQTTTEVFAQNIVSHLVSLEHAALPGTKESGNATPTSVSGSSVNIKVLEYTRSPKVSKSLITAPSAFLDEPDTAKLGVPYLLSDGSGGGASKHRRHSAGSISSTSANEVALTMEDVDTPPYHTHNNTSPEEVLSTQDTYGEDTTDMMSSDVDGDVQKTKKHKVKLKRVKDSTSYSELTDSSHTHQSPQKVFSLSERELLYSVFGLLRINRIGCEVQIETTKLSIELSAISGAVDVRKSLPPSRPQQRSPSIAELDQLLHFDLLPTYLSVAANLRRSLVRINDRGLSDNDILLFSALPVYGSVGVFNHTHQRLPTYRCLLKFTGLELDIKQSPVKVHRRYQQLLPSFTKIYNDVFASSSVEGDPLPPSEMMSSKTTPNLSKITNLKLPSHFPRGVVHFKIDKVALIMAPLPSLTVTYQVAPVMAQIETSHEVGFQLGVGEHKLRFSPKEQYKDELSLRSLTLPVVNLRGAIQRREKTKAPQVRVEVNVKVINIDLTTDVLNQLLIVQNSFIKELNDLLQTLLGIGESIPHGERLKHIKPEAVADDGLELLSFLDSCQFSLSGIAITVSTPLGTAIRFSTGKIEMHLTNTSHPVLPTSVGPLTSKTQFSLVGRVEIDMTLALGYLQDVGPDVVDDLCELANFKTRISIRNTFENIARSSIPGAEGAEPALSEAESTVEVDTFLINILSPHLYIQSRAVEQAILFWLNCKSVYTYWQNERKQLTAEVQAATEALIEKIQRPTQLQTPSIDFSKPRLVQITVTDVGACMPLQPMTTTPHSQQKGFPALVITIREMHFLLNLSRKVASTGRFQTFCIRFAEQFYLRQKTWTLDPKRHKFINYAIVNQGTFRLCIANKKRYSEVEPEKEVGEKLLWAFQWNMSGIDVNASTDIGRHMSTLVRTVTTIGSDMDNKGTLKKIKSAATVSSPKLQQARAARKFSSGARVHRRAHSLVHHRGGLGDDPQAIALQQELARQTRKVQKLKSSGATGDSLKSEEERLRKMEQELAKKVHRLFKHPREGLTLHQINQIFSPRPMSTKERSGGARKWSSVVRKKLFSLSEEPGAEAESRDKGGRSATLSPAHLRRRTQSVVSRSSAHKRNRSDITGLSAPMLSPSSSPCPSPAQTPPPWEDGVFEGERPSSSLGGDDHLSSSTGSTVDKMEVSGEGEELEGEEEASFIFPSIDVEVDITISVEYGSIRLHTEESESSGRRFSIPTSGTLSSNSSHTKLSATPTEPYLSKTFSGKASDVETLILIPALTVKAHYQSIVGRSYSQRHAPHSPLRQSPVPKAHSPTHQVLSPPGVNRETEVDAKPALPVKKGILCVSAVVASLPEDIKLTPSLLEFIEHVARPTIAATVVTSSSSGDSEDGESGEEEGEVASQQQQAPDSWPVSFPVHVTLAFQIQPSTVYLTCRPHSRVECIIQSPDVNFVISFSLFCPQHMEGTPPTVGGSPPDSISLHSASIHQSRANTVAFNNLYVTGCLTTFVLQLYSPQISTLKQAGETVVEKKEALSLTLGQAFIHLSRKSVLALLPGAGRGGVKSVDDYKPHNKLQVSVITHIASLVLGYDMRRLNDITAFRRYWYSTSLVETLFIGSRSKPSGEEPMSATPSDLKSTSSESESVVDIDNTISATIAVAAKVEDFRVAANFAQVMGHADLLVTHLKCEGHADISHNELVLLQVDTKLDKGELDARGGVIAGAVLVENIQAHVVTHSEQNTIPEHRGSASIDLIEGRVEYMSSAIVLARATQLSVELFDVWEGLQLASKTQHPDTQQANIEVRADFSWEGLQIAINRSTSKNIFNIVQKLYDFVMQQKRRSERTISLMLPTGSAASKALQAYREEQKRAEEEKTALKEDMRHHWLWAVKVGSVELMKTLGIHFPDDSQHGVSLGGKITISGQNLCIVCFHGPSFRENEWAVFNIDHVHSSFSTLAIPGLSSLSQIEEGRPHAETHVRTCQQIVNLILGNSDTAVSSGKELAAIYRVQLGRSRVPPVASTPIQNWLAYACIDSHIHPDNYASDNSTLVRLSRKLTVHPLLIMPSFSVELINDHFWPCQSHDLEEGLPPRVECSLISSFDQPGIAVTTTVDHYLFLHDLVKAYVDYFEKHKAPSSTGTGLLTRTSFGYDTQSPLLSPKSSATSSAATPPLSPTTSEAGYQGRQFECVCWELDPQLLLLSTVSGQFNPHISWVLEKLGFKHARTTIPKWIQRGAMDPLDLVVASVLELLVKLTASKKLKLRTSHLPPSLKFEEGEGLNKSAPEPH